MIQPKIRTIQSGRQRFKFGSTRAMVKRIWKDDDGSSDEIGDGSVVGIWMVVDRDGEWKLKDRLMEMGSSCWTCISLKWISGWNDERDGIKLDGCVSLSS
ncbi:hypothetical protein F2Q69_00036831 [Brassica cretica]|uniref:Uncharacterized protein n=1 Tax=Brassica cretica TaxID=69181 RepID=A0A8S9SPH1_BRACR|nr:hypothetical protein F2Q69_00036831 [Brassica cretica]